MELVDNLNKKWCWPKKPDILSYKLSAIKHKIEPPRLLSGRSSGDILFKIPELQ